MTRYTDWQGNRKQKCKRGFSTKREAQERAVRPDLRDLDAEKLHKGIAAVDLHALFFQ